MWDLWSYFYKLESLSSYGSIGISHLLAGLHCCKQSPVICKWDSCGHCKDHTWPYHHLEMYLNESTETLSAVYNVHHRFTPCGHFKHVWIRCTWHCLNSNAFDHIFIVIHCIWTYSTWSNMEILIMTTEGQMFTFSPSSLLFSQVVLMSKCSDDPSSCYGQRMDVPLRYLGQSILPMLIYMHMNIYIYLCAYV